MSHSERVSVIVPMYNAERFIGDAIDSIQNQTTPVSEIVVVDDGSTDNCYAVASKFKMVKCVRQENAGAGPARNFGVAESSCPLIAFLDSDDLWVPSKIENQIAAMRTDPQLDALFGHAEQFSSADTDSSGDQSVTTVEKATGHAMPAHLPSSMLIRRKAFDRVGGYSGDWKVGEVVDWYCRAVDTGLKMRTLPEVVYRRRLHDDNLGVRERESQDDYLQIVRQAIRRRKSIEQRDD